MKKQKVNIILVVVLSSISFIVQAQSKLDDNTVLNAREQNLVAIAASAGKGDLPTLKTALNKGLEAGLTVNQIKEALIHLYAYAGFPRSLRGLQTFMVVVDERKAKGIKDVTGAEASPVSDQRSRYERGKDILEKLTGVPETGPKTGYAAFAPAIEVFLKEHLFADLFERDILTYVERELVTISVLSSIGGVEPMLRSHLNICLRIGLTATQLQQFIGIIEKTTGKEEAKAAQAVLQDALKARKADTGKVAVDTLFPKGDKVTNNHFTGTVWVSYLTPSDSVYNVNIGSVTFEPGARTNWHYHKGGQILLVTAGSGLYQEKGKPVQIIGKGKVIQCPPNTEHWHGATPTETMTHIAIGTNTNVGGAVWLKPVTDEEYRNVIPNQ